MAVAVGEIQVTVNTRIPIGSGRAIYLGTAAGGTEYPTGGATLGDSTLGRYSLPTSIDTFILQGAGVSSRFVSPNKVQLYGGAATEVAGVELKSKATMAVVAATPFICIGDA